MEELWIPRPFVADEINCARLSDLLVELYPQLPRQSADELMARQASLRSTGRPFQRLICGPPDEIWAMVTWRTPPWMAKNDMLLFAVCVAKAHQGQGHGPRLLAEVVAAAQACGATELGAQAFDTDPGTLRWLQRYGLAVAQTNQWSALSLKGPLPAPVVTTHQRVLGSGIELLDGDALAMRFPEDWETRWYQIEAAIERDVPSPILRDEITLEAWRRRCAGSEVQPRGFHFALEGSRVVGMTG